MATASNALMLVLVELMDSDDEKPGRGKQGTGKRGNIYNSLYWKTV